MLNEKEIRKTIELMKPNSQLFEVRVIFNNKAMYSGYFNDADSLMAAFRELNVQGECNVYITLNSINPACYDRQQKNTFCKNAKITTSDNDIIGYDWLMIDLDPKRPSGTSSTNEQIEKAKEYGSKIYQFMRNLGFSKPLFANSGNGVHLLYRIRLKNSDENRKLIELSLKTLNMLFTSSEIDVDMKNFNQSRVCKLYGTKAQKGANSSDRPHRMSYIIGNPEAIEVNDIKYLQKLCDLYPKEEKPQKYNNYHPREFDLEEWMNKYGLRYRKSGYSDGTKYILDCCPFDSNHKGKDACIFHSRTGAIGFHCFHNSCADKTWKDVRLLFEPDAYEKRQQEYEKRIYSKSNKNVPKKIEETEGKPLFFTAMDILNMPKKEETFIKSGIKTIDDKMRGLKKSYISVISGLRACVDCDTEYFNGYEWKKISDYEIGEQVLQYNEDGTANLVYPSVYHKHEQEYLWRIKTKNIDMCVSENHDMVYVSSKGNLVRKPFSHIAKLHKNSKNGFTQKFITTFECFGKGIDLTDEQIRVMCMVICDGSISKRRTVDDKCRVNIKKSRKKKRCESLLKDAGIEYSCGNYNPSDPEYLSFMFIPPLPVKEFPREWYQCNKHQMEIIAEEVIEWDGYKTKDGALSFSQTNKNTIDFLQFVFTCLGRRTSISIDDRRGKIDKRDSGKEYLRKNIGYAIRVCKGSKLVGIMNPDKKLEFEKYKTTDGFMYCFTVQSHMLVLRRNGRIFITGNCGKSSIISNICLDCVDSENRVGVFSGELAPKNFMRWMNLQAAGKGYVESTQFDGYYNVSRKYQEKIANWLGDKFLLYNNEYGNDFSAIIEEFKKKIENDKLDLLILDNLMAFNISSLSDNKWDAQTEFVLSLKRLAVEKDIHIVFVAHPRKAMGFLRLDDISGTGDLGNAVDNAFIVHRVNNDFIRLTKQMFGWKDDNELYQATNVIEIAKDRDGGLQDIFIPLFYEKESKRLKNYQAENKIYGWNKTDDGFSSVEDLEIPFEE